jgi:hypothetical protein
MRKKGRFLGIFLKKVFLIADISYRKTGHRLSNCQVAVAKLLRSFASGVC